MQDLTPYDSDESIYEPTQPPRKKTRIMKNWIYKTTFEKKEEAMLQFDQEGLWSKVRAYDTISGRREDYQCNKVPSRQLQLINNHSKNQFLCPPELQRERLFNFIKIFQFSNFFFII